MSGHATVRQGAPVDLARRALPGMVHRPLLWPMLDAISFATGMLLAGPLPVAEIGGVYDDLLFVRLAHFITQGRWLGPFDNLTLIKGPFYSLFLAACAACGIPIQVATQGVYLVASLLLARTAGLLAGKRWVGSVCFALLALNPACYDWSTAMLMREPLYGGLTTLVLALGARAFLCRGGTLAWSILLGLAGGAFWLTREEGVLILPPMLSMAAWHVFVRRPSLAKALRAPLISGSMAVVLVLAVCAVNQHYYGVFRTNDVKNGAFARAYGALVRVDPQRWRRLVAVPREARLRIYAASPAAAELRPYLEGDSAHFGLDVDCSSVPSPECHDIDSAHFLFALRDAVARAGHYRTAKDADRFYRRMAREIDDACRRQVLRCSGRRQGLWPQLGWNYAHPFAASLALVIADTVSLGNPHSDAPSSLLQGADKEAYDSLVISTPITPPADLLTAPGWHISGTLSAADPAARIVVAGPPGTAIQSDLRQSINVDISNAAHHPPGQGEGFTDDVRCQPGKCSLQLIDATGTLGSWPLANLAPGGLLSTGQAALFVDTVEPLSRLADQLYRPTLRRRLMIACDELLPLLTELTSLPVVAWVIWRVWIDVRRRSVRPLTVFALALTLTIAARIALLSALDATTVAVQFRYEAPATGALLCLVGLMLCRAVSAVSEFASRQRPARGVPADTAF